MPENIDESKKSIIVPIDFTSVSLNALEYAIFIAKNNKYTISLINIIKKDSERKSAFNKLQHIFFETEKKHNILLDFHVKTGSIFTEINEFSKEISAELVVMGTHGMKGMQKVFGSWALKVIAASDIPYIVIQDIPSNYSLQKVVFPLDYKKEDKEKLNWAYYLAKNFKSKIFIYKARKDDPNFKRNIDLNLSYSIKFFEKLNIPYEIYSSDKSDDFAKQTIDFAQNIKADVILIMTTKNINITDFIFGAQEQYLITNNVKIPVMCVNPKPLSIMGSFSAGG